MKDLTPAWTERNAATREVLIAGETFHYRAGLRPEEILALGDVDKDAPQEETFALLDKLIMLLLEPDDHAHWAKLRERGDQPLTGFDIREVFDSLVELAIGRPPTKPSDSSSLPEEPGTISMDGSSPLQAVPLRT